MKKIIFILASIVITGTGFYGCKKGENDPTISLKSRDGRITAKWKLTKIEGSESWTVWVPYSIVTTAITYDGSMYTETDSPGGRSSGTGAYEMTIDKKGKVSWASNYTQTAPSIAPADVRSGAGHWQWLNSNKNKDHLIIDGSGDLFGGGLLYVDRLTGKELVLKYTAKNVNDLSASSEDYTYTFAKQ